MCFWDSNFPFRRLEKKSYSEFADSRKEKKSAQRDKNGNTNTVVFSAILAHPSHMQFLLKSQNKKVIKHNSKYLIRNTMSHIGFRSFFSIYTFYGLLNSFK